MSKREPRLTRKERQALEGKGPAGTPRVSSASSSVTQDALKGMEPGAHIHCIACGKHLDTVGEARKREGGFDSLWATLRCDHGSPFFSCLSCTAESRKLLAEHDRTGQAVRAAQAWH